METIGARIKRLRIAKGWKRPELGRRMAEAIGREKPFAGESIRRYEEDIDKPRPDGREALAKVFEKDAVYIEFGQSAEAGQGSDYTAIERQLIARFRAADPRWKLSLQLLAALAVEDQIEVASDVNVIVARILGKKPAEVRYASDERVAATLKPVPGRPVLKVEDGRTKSARPDVRRLRKTR